jgi:hypothetical protein
VARDGAEIIREQARRIEDSGVLGRSRSYSRLLRFLVDCSAAGRTPKELEIATEVFGKGPDFDPSQDSLVRVYAHNLRQKLEQYYAKGGAGETHGIAVPKGEYRVVVVDRRETAAADARHPAGASRWWAPLAGLALLLVGVLIGLGIRPGAEPPAGGYHEVARSPLWAEMLNDRTPVLVVVGDYYIFAELDGRGNVRRLVREFAVNSGKDLDDWMLLDADLRERYLDLDLTYLPRAAAFALRDLLRVLYTSDKPVRLVSMSELNVADLRSNHVIYVGYVSALDKLQDFVFASSTLAVGDTYDELLHLDTGQLYASGAGFAAGYRNYRDYGLFSTFPGPGGNQLMIVAGTRDAGLMHTAYALTDLAQVRAIEAAMPEKSGHASPAFEVLYEVMGYDRTSLDAMLVHSAPLDYQAIWGGEPLRLRIP